MLKSLLFYSLVAILSACQSIQQTRREMEIPEPHYRHGWEVFSGQKPTEVLISDEDSVRRGERVFSAKCTSCHGKNAKGDGPLAKGLEIKPANLTELPKIVSNTYILIQINEGRGNMPQWRDFLTSKEAVDVTNYIRSLNQE